MNIKYKAAAEETLTFLNTIRFPALVYHALTHTDCC